MLRKRYLPVCGVLTGRGVELSDQQSRSMKSSVPLSGIPGDIFCSFGKAQDRFLLRERPCNDILRTSEPYATARSRCCAWTTQPLFVKRHEDFCEAVLMFIQTPRSIEVW